VELAVAVAVNVNVLAFGTLTIWYCWFKTELVILPPRPVAPLKVTKSLTLAPWLVADTDIEADPAVAVNGFVKVLTCLIGVIS